LLSRRVPSLLDRYGSYGAFVGNPNLKTELDWTAILGTEAIEKRWELSLQGYVQFRENARVTTFETVYNADDAWITALLGKGQVLVTPFLDFFDSITLSRSALGATGGDFPYVPTILNVFGFKFHSEKHPHAWEWMTAWRTSSSRIYQIGNDSRLSGYGVIDSTLQVEMTKGISLGGRVENIFNRSYELIQGFPIGRVASLLLVGEL
jgi:outer membrane cobalamin receptor